MPNRKPKEQENQKPEDVKYITQREAFENFWEHEDALEIQIEIDMRHMEEWTCEYLGL